MNDVQRVPTQKIVENLKIASRNRLELKNNRRIYQELNARIDQSLSVDAINELKKFPSIYKKYEEEKPTYYYPHEVFRSNSKKKEFSTEYIEFLSPEFVGSYKKLLDRLNVLQEPNAVAILLILDEIQEKYKHKDYRIDDTTDVRIIINCINELDQLKVILTYLETIQNMNILCNTDNVLIKPHDAIFIDRLNVQKDIDDELKAFLIPYQEEYINIFDKMGVTRISKIIRKDIQTMPDINKLEIEHRATRKLLLLISLINRIKAGKFELSPKNGVVSIRNLKSIYSKT